ncbi:MAG: hypothetical protein KJO07_00895 [Deltaproteobacteria bacterium]|nr:hypothetical protein [Deltaproteobacteria bacterium]
MLRTWSRVFVASSVIVLLSSGCGGGDSYGGYSATITIGGDCSRTERRGADVEVFGRNVIVSFYTPAGFEDCVGGFEWDWDGNLDTGMEQFIAGPCLLGLAVDFPPQDILPPEDRAFSSLRANDDGSYTIEGGTGAIENAELTGYVCQGPLDVQIQPR